MCSRLIHDLSAPLSAIAIGVDMLPENNDLDSPYVILKASVRSAISRLEVLRCLCGYTDSQKKPTLQEAVSLLNKSIDPEKIHMKWLCPIDEFIISGNSVRLLMAIVLIAIESLPRGGSIFIHPNFLIEVTGGSLKPNAEAIHALTGKSTFETITSRGVIGYLAYILAESLEIKMIHTYKKPNHMTFCFS